MKLPKTPTGDPFYTSVPNLFVFLLGTRFLFVQAIPVILNLTEPLIIQAGTNWSLQCIDDEDMEWIFPNHENVKTRASVHSLARFNSSLGQNVHRSEIHISLSETNDTGRYECRQKHGAKNVSTNTYVFVYDESQLLLPIQAYIKVLETDPVAVIPCVPTHPDAVVTLFKHPSSCIGVQPKCVSVQITKKMKFDPHHGFVISHPSSIFNGDFYCKAKLGSNEEKSKIFHLIWTANHNNAPLPLIEGSSTIRLLTRESFNLTCHIPRLRGYSLEEMRWITPTGKAIIHSNQTKWVKENNEHVTTLSVDNVTDENAGEYSCQITLKDSYANKSSSVILVHVIQRTPPMFLETNLNNSIITEDLGSNVNLSCVPGGIPEPTVSWYKDNEPIHHLPGIDLKDNDTLLMVMRITEATEGNYSCKIENSEGILYVNTTLNVKPHPPAALTSIVSAAGTGIIIAAIVIIVIIVPLLLKVVYKERKHRRDLAMLEKMLFQKGDPDNIDPDMPLIEQVELLPYDRRWEFSRDQLKLGKPLGQGAFGRVVKAQAFGLLGNDRPVTVAVKLLKERADLSHQKALLQELKIMIHLGRHINILNLLGACTKDIHKGGLMVIVEYCSQGNLRHFLLNHRDVFVNQVDPRTGALFISADFLSIMDEDSTNRSQSNSYEKRKLFPAPSSICDATMDTQMTNLSHTDGLDYLHNCSADISDASLTEEGKKNKKRPLTTCDLLCMAFQVSRGMEYLSAKKLVHRDLAARNILLTEDRVIKICDFGLAKDLYKYGIYKKKGNGPLPVKWMALESIRDREFSTKSDIWSFGIVLWELFTLGGNPYPGIEVDEEFFQKLLKGYRLGKPDFASSDIYTVMTDCWKPEPKERPSFTELVDRIGSQLDDNIKKYYVNLSAIYPLPNAEKEKSAEYIPMDPGDQSSETTPLKLQQPERPSQLNYINVADGIVSGQGNEYLMMDSPVSKTFPPLFKKEVQNAYVNTPTALAHFDASSLKVQLQMQNGVMHDDSRRASSLSCISPSTPTDDPHYRIPPSGKCIISNDRLRINSDTSSGIVADIGHHVEGTFV